MKRALIILAAAVALALTLAAGAGADGNGATVTRATLPSGLFDGTTLFPATCDETQVVNQNGRQETFHCTFDEGVPAPFVCDTSIGCVWFSDFDGAEAINTHFVVTHSGLMVGWARF